MCAGSGLGVDGSRILSGVKLVHPSVGFSHGLFEARREIIANSAGRTGGGEALGPDLADVGGTGAGQFGEAPGGARLGDEAFEIVQPNSVLLSGGI